MEKISEIVKKVFETLNPRELTLDYQEINSSLKKVLSPKELKAIQLNSFRKGTLKISTDSSIFLYQLNLKKDLILKRLQNDFGPDFVKRIIFHLGDNNV